MIPMRPTGKESVPGHKQIILSDFDASWAGEAPSDNMIWIGSEDGRIAMTSTQNSEAVELYAKSNSGEAVNGVAFANGIIAVSSRADISFFRQIPGENAVEESVREHGAHGIVSTRRGTFVAPLGQNGLLWTEFSQDQTLESTVWKADKPFYYYKVASLGLLGSDEVITCAMRRGGLATIVQRPDGGKFKAFTYSGVDVIDVNSLDSTEFPMALAALGIDGSLHLTRDIAHETTLQTIKTNLNYGNAYRVLVAQGHIFVLTSKSLLTFHDLASRYLDSGQLSGPLKVSVLDVQAVDVSVAFGRSLLLVMPEAGVTVYNVSELVGGKKGRVKNPSILYKQQSWEISAPLELTTCSV